MKLDFSGLSTLGGDQSKVFAAHLRVRLEIFPVQDEHPFAPKRKQQKARVIDWTPKTQASLLRFYWNKTMGPASGPWSATVKARVGEGNIDFESDVRDGDWVDATVMRNGVLIPLFRGVIDTVRLAKESSGGATTRLYTITGRDHGAFFEYPITWANLWARNLGELVKGYFTERVDGAVGGRPDELFRVLISGYLRGSAGGNAQWRLPFSLQDKLGAPLEQDSTLVGDATELRVVGSSLFEALKVVTFNAAGAQGAGARKGLRGAFYNQLQLWPVGEQSLHQTLSQWVNPMLNEWYYDLLLPTAFMPPNRLAAYLSTNKDLFKGTTTQADDPQVATSPNASMAAIIRERPFPTAYSGTDSMWYGLPAWTIPSWMVSRSDLGRSGYERFNVFELLADYGFATQTDLQAYGPPVWDPQDVKTHGLRVYSQNTKYLAEGNAAEGKWTEERMLQLRILRDWFGPNPYLKNGSLDVNTLLPEIRIGQRVWLDNGVAGEAEQYYVEGVRLIWEAPTQSAGAKGATSLTVTRGFRGSDQDIQKRMTDMDAAYQQVLQ